MNTGQIIKSKSTERFTTLPNDLIKSKVLTLEDKGLLSYLLSLPADWIIYKQNLYNSLPDAKNKIDRTFKSLQDKGYIKSIKVTDKNTGRFIGWNHIVYDIITDTEEIRQSESPTSEYSEIGKLDTIQKTNYITNTDIIQNTKDYKTVKNPILSDVIEFFISKNDTEENAKKAFEYYDTANWYDSRGKKVKNWKQKMLANWINNNNFKKTTNGKTTSEYYQEHYNRNLTWANEWDAAEGRSPFPTGEEN